MTGALTPASTHGQNESILLLRAISIAHADPGGANNCAILLGRGACASRDESAEGMGEEDGDGLPATASEMAEAVLADSLRRPGERMGEEKERR